MKELGRYQQVNMLGGFEAWSMALLTRVLGWSAEEVQALLGGARKELVDRSLHLYVKYYWVYGQKPE